MAAKTDPINTSNPAGDSDPKQGDDYIRTLAKALIELLTVDHYVGVANPWGSDASGDETGEHARVMFHEAISNPSVDAGKGVLFIKGTPPELYFRDEDDGNVIQLTNGGIVNLTSAALLGILANDVYFTGVDNAGTGTVNLIKVGTNDLATLPDSAEMASNAAPVEDEAIANKKYVDDQAWAGGTKITTGSGKLTTSYVEATDLTFTDNFVGSKKIAIQVSGGFNCDDGQIIYLKIVSGAWSQEWSITGGDSNNSFRDIFGFSFAVTVPTSDVTGGSQAFTVSWKASGTASNGCRWGHCSLSYKEVS